MKQIEKERKFTREGRGKEEKKDAEFTRQRLQQLDRQLTLSPQVQSAPDGDRAEELSRRTQGLVKDLAIVMASREKFLTTGETTPEPMRGGEILQQLEADYRSFSPASRTRIRVLLEQAFAEVGVTGYRVKDIDGELRMVKE